MFNEKVYNPHSSSDSAAIQHLADELAVQNLLTILKNVDLPKNEAHDIELAIRMYAIMTSSMLAEKVNKGISTPDDSFHRVLNRDVQD